MEEFWHGVVDFFKNAGLNILYGIIILIVGLIIVKLIKEVLKRILARANATRRCPASSCRWSTSSWRS